MGILGGGMYLMVLQILTLFQTKKWHFLHLFSDLYSKKLCHHYLIRTQTKTIFKNLLQIGILLFLSY